MASVVYALGAVLYEMVAGRPPFVVESPVAVAVAHVREDPQPLAQMAGVVPPNIAAAAMAALAKDPGKRPASATAFASMLRETTLQLPPIDAADETTPLAPVVPGSEETKPLSPVPRHGDRRRILILALLVGALLLLTLAITMALASDRWILQQAQQEARAESRVAVPELTGMTKADALDALDDGGLVLGDVQREPGETGIVIASEPPAGERVRRGTSVTLIVGTSTPPTEEPPKEHKDHGKHLG